MTVPARTQPYTLNPDQIKAYNDQGFIVIEDFYTAEEHASLVQYCDDLQNWGEAKGKWMQYYEKNTRSGDKQLCRTENFTPFHDGLREYVRSQRLMDVLKELHGEEYILFKEKVNYKLPGGGGKRWLCLVKIFLFKMYLTKVYRFPSTSRCTCIRPVRSVIAYDCYVHY
jgi:hypothetical protein